ncbi:MAG: hypothetical protein RMK84_04055 [Oscillochloridaceae bacterium]|nr:hypothetical protein [Chloroflexaceae bacterium]MDW8389278.1 hypothetical protein [Oscillochloridaceae bacterium]
MIWRVLFTFCLLLSLLRAAAHGRLATALARETPSAAQVDQESVSGQLHPSGQPEPAIEPFVRPDLARRLERLRPVILAAAKRHNHPELSGMDDESFAVVIALIIYNENFGWLEDDVPPLRLVTPLYQRLQQVVNQRLPGSNFSVWPVNLRPSVALEILQQQLPLADGRMIHMPVRVEGSEINLAAYAHPAELLAAINAEISRDELAVAYLAANLERGLYRAVLEGAPVTWQTLAAWHNQGIVDPQAIRANPTARDYVRRAAAFLPLARALIAGSGEEAAPIHPYQACQNLMLDPVTFCQAARRDRAPGDWMRASRRRFRERPREKARWAGDWAGCAPDARRRAPGRVIVESRRTSRASRLAGRAGAPTLAARTRED